MNRATRWLRRTEIVLWAIGLGLLGAALGASADRWMWQAEQEQALLLRAAPPERASAPALASHPVPEPVPVPELEPDPEAEPVPEPEKINPPRDRRAPDPSVLGLLEIPRLGLSAIVREGDDPRTLHRAVGYLADTAKPGEGGNTALAAHRDTFFRPLERIEPGDLIRLVAPPETFEYRVTSTSIVGPTEVGVLDSTGVEELTLVTCHPFRWIGPAPDRFVVKAARVQ